MEQNTKVLESPPCWMQEIGKCIKGYEGRFLNKASYCIHCDVFAQEASKKGLSDQDFMVQQLHRYDQYIISELQSTNQRLNKKVDELSVLLDISTLMQGTTDLDEILHIILSGLTAGFALGFNRALLFLVDEPRRELVGKMGVGPETGEEANLIWTTMSRAPHSLSRIVSPEAIQAMKNSRMTQMAQQIRKGIDPAKGVLSKTILEKKAFIVTDASHDDRVNREILDLLQSNTFATVPLIAKDKAIGVIYVDNYYNKEPITEEDIASLTRFSALAGLAIAETIAYEQIERFNEQLEGEIERAKAELRATEHALAHQEKLAALGQMAAGVAHELRNPMTSVRGFAQRISRRVPEGDPNKKYADIIVEEIDRINQLIRDILEYSKKGEPINELNSISEVLEDVLFLFRDSISKYSIEIAREYEDVPPFYFDTSQLKQILTNITGNAIDALETSGTLTLRTRYDEKWVYIDIADTGPGIWTEILKDIFNPFFTTKATGTGLGLSIAHRMANSLGGDIFVQSQVGQGSTFTVKLPYLKELINHESDDI